MLVNAQSGFKAKKLDLDLIDPIATVEDILTLRQQVQDIQVEDNILDYLLDLVERTRQHPDLALGASPRSAVAWLNASKANACLSGRNYVIPDDVKEIAAPLLRHRLILKPEAQLDNVQLDELIAFVLKQVSVPR
ncbi:MAG TPA: MoxR family ATPase [Coleofasciculaceae cyanobacterium]|jgi:MoxR-like ATPase